MRFVVERVPDTRIVRARMSQLFSAADAAGMQQAYVALLSALGYRAGTFGLLVDMTASPIQSADIVTGLSKFVQHGDRQPGRVAFVHGGAAVKMQARRVSADLGGRHFASEAEALGWLASDGLEHGA